MKIIGWRRALRFMLVVALIILSMARIEDSFAINLWSLEYLWRVSGKLRGESILLSAPENHASAPLWLAKEALQEGNPYVALALITPMASTKDPRAISIYAAILDAQGKFSAALESWILAEDHQSLIEVGKSKAQLGELDDASQAYINAWLLQPQLGALPLATFLQENLGDTRMAEEILRTVLARFPRSPHRSSWLSRLGDILRAQGLLKEAKEIYQEALSENHNNIDARIGLGWARYEDSDGIAAAARDFRLATSLDETSGNGYFAIGKMLFLEMRYEEADSWFELALERNQKKEWCLARANSARSAGNMALALRLYRKIISNFPNYAEAYFELAWHYRLSGDPVEAEVSIQRAIAEMISPSEWFYVRAGQIYEWKGKSRDALLAYQQALQINSDNSLAQMGIRRLNGY